MSNYDKNRYDYEPEYRMMVGFESVLAKYETTE